MMNRNFVVSFASIVSIVAFAVGCSENDPFTGNSNGADVPPESCPALGSSCTNETGKCADTVCHCGYVVVAESDQAKAECPSGQQPADACVPGKACKPNGDTCEGDSGKLTCACGMWATPAMIDKMDCSPDNNPGTGGSGGSGGGDTGGSGGGSNVGGSGGGTNVGGSGGGQTAPTGWHTFHIHVLANGDHLYCQGANTAQKPDADGVLKWYQDWHSFGCDSWGTGIFECDVPVMDGAALQFQCYVENPTATYGVNDVDYTCRIPQSALVYEFRVTDDGVLVKDVPLVTNGSPQSGDGFYNCNIFAD